MKALRKIMLICMLFSTLIFTTNCKNRRKLNEELLEQVKKVHILRKPHDNRNSLKIEISINRIKELLRKGANPDYKNKIGFNSLHIAVFTGHIDMVKLLLENGANANIYSGLENFTDEDFMKHPLFVLNTDGGQEKVPSLYFAIKGKELKIAQYLIDNGANVNNPGHCLEYLSPEEKIEILRFLFKNGFDANSEIKSKYFLIHNCVYHLDVLKYIVENGANTNVKDDRGQTPLHIAVRYPGDIKIIKYLLKNGADNNAKDEKGKKPVDLAEGEIKDYLKSIE